MEALNKTVIKKEVKWTSEQEELLAEWAEKAKCYRWLHSRAEKKYRKRNCRYNSCDCPIDIDGYRQFCHGYLCPRRT